MRYIIPATVFALMHFTLPCLGQRLLSNAGGSATNGLGYQVQYSLGEPFVGTKTNGLGIQATQGMEQPTPVRVSVSLGAWLQGPWDGEAMDDGLRAGGLVPLAQPYTAMGYDHDGTETVQPAVLAAAGPAAIVDWVLLELRDANLPGVVTASRAALLCRDGTVVDTDGASPVAFHAAPRHYYVAVRHRNHLGAMTAAPVMLSGTPTMLDLRDGSTATYGTEALREANGAWQLWAGDVTGDGVLRYTGAANDRDPILAAGGGLVPTEVATGYLREDVNMDGTAKYTGAANDRDPILQNVGGTTPTATRMQQIP
ncbi:MAG: hypothetical protein RBT71_05635 [Flavobacteriales bacterium]|jgi:hypothetical protein|nr:hypothetical protein [Flavobacteriales bacterium]